MESDINSGLQRSADDIPEKGCAHTLTQTVCHNFRLVYITVGVHNSVIFTLGRTVYVSLER